MTDTQLILQKLGEIDTRLDGIDIRLDGIDTRLDGIDMRLDKMDVRMDRLEEKINNVELGLEQEIDKVYLLTLQNAENIKLLLPYKDRIINVSRVVSTVDELDSRQTVTEEVVASHSADIREIKAKLA